MTACCWLLIPKLYTGFETGGEVRVTSSDGSGPTRTVLDIDPHGDLSAITSLAVSFSKSMLLRYGVAAFACLALVASPVAFSPKTRGWLYCGIFWINLLVLFFEMEGIFMIFFVL
jgi:hypothetical protein